MNFGKTLELTSDQLKKLNLKYGKNEIRYEVFTMLQEIFEIFYPLGTKSKTWDHYPALFLGTKSIEALQVLTIAGNSSFWISFPESVVGTVQNFGIYSVSYWHMPLRNGMYGKFLDPERFLDAKSKANKWNSI